MKTTYLKKNILAAVLVLTLALALTACAGGAGAPSAAAEPDSGFAGEQQTFTLDALAKYDGQDGNPAYIAIEGVVYDVSDVRQWQGGKHNGFTAGKDLTEQMQSAPHGFSKLNGLTAVGVLAQE